MSRLILTPEEEHNAPPPRDSRWTKFFKWFNKHKDFIAFIVTAIALLITLYQGCSNLNYIKQQTKIQDSVFTVSRLDKVSDNRKEDSLRLIQAMKDRSADSALRDRDERQNTISKLSVEALKDQNQTSKLQYELQKKLYDEQMRADRGRIVLMSVDLLDKEEKVYSFPAPKLLLRFSNIGKRDVVDFTCQIFVLNKFYTVFSHLDNTLLTKSTVSPSEVFNQLHLPKFRYYDSVDDFFLYAPVVYHDEILNKKFELSIYLHYYKARGEFAFSECTIDEKLKIDNSIKLYH